MVTGFMVALLCSCAERVVAPTDGVATVKVANIVVTFDFESKIITAENNNYDTARIEIGRWNNDANDFLRIFCSYIYGYKEVTKYAAFRHGDYIRIKIWIGGTEIPPECFTLG